MGWKYKSKDAAKKGKAVAGKTKEVAGKAKRFDLDAGSKTKRKNPTGDGLCDYCGKPAREASGNMEGIETCGRMKCTNALTALL